MIKNMCFLLRGPEFKCRGWQGIYTSIDFSSQIIAQRGSLSHKKGGLIHQFGVWISRDLKIRLLLLLLLLLSSIKLNS
jgi:hypothetical protein